MCILFNILLLLIKKLNIINDFLLLLYYMHIFPIFLCMRGRKVKKKGLNIHLVPIFVVFIQFGPYFHFGFNQVLIFVKLWSIWSFSLTVFKQLTFLNNTCHVSTPSFFIFLFFILFYFIFLFLLIFSNFFKFFYFKKFVHVSSHNCATCQS